MARPIWKGYISFGLVNIPVILHAAEKKFDIQFKLVDSRDHARIRYVRVNEHTGEEVPWSEVAKGYEYDDKGYVLLSNAELKDIAGENSKMINIESFVAADSLDYIDFDKPYYLVPDKNGDKGYVILREVLKSTKKIGIAKVVIHTRQYLAALMPYENALILNLLRYEQELKKPADFDLPADNLKKYKVTPREIEVAKQLVASMTTKWNPDDYHDEYRAALEKFVDEKVHHAKHPTKHKKSVATKKSNVIDLVGLLKKSLKDQKNKHHPHPHKPKHVTRHK